MTDSKLEVAGFLIDRPRIYADGCLASKDLIGHDIQRESCDATSTNSVLAGCLVHFNVVS